MGFALHPCVQRLHAIRSKPKLLHLHVCAQSMSAAWPRNLLSRLFWLGREAHVLAPQCLMHSHRHNVVVHACGLGDKLVTSFVDSAHHRQAPRSSSPQPSFVSVACTSCNRTAATFELSLSHIYMLLDRQAGDIYRCAHHGQSPHLPVPLHLIFLFLITATFSHSYSYSCQWLD